MERFLFFLHNIQFLCTIITVKEKRDKIPLPYKFIVIFKDILKTCSIILFTLHLHDVHPLSRWEELISSEFATSGQLSPSLYWCPLCKHDFFCNASEWFLWRQSPGVVFTHAGQQLPGRNTGCVQKIGGQVMGQQSDSPFFNCIIIGRYWVICSNCVVIIR